MATGPKLEDLAGAVHTLIDRDRGLNEEDRRQLHELIDGRSSADTARAVAQARADEAKAAQARAAEAQAAADRASDAADEAAAAEKKESAAEADAADKAPAGRNSRR